MAALFAVAAALASYQRVMVIDNSTFLQNVDFFTDDDPTGGSVTFVSQEDALSSGLVQVTGGHIYMSADRQNDGVPRRSVRVNSKATFTRGLFIIDLEHMPTGCGTWPAYWTCGPSWPDGGEIDIIEGVHRQQHDATTLHTSEGCTMAGVNTSSFTGSWNPGIGGGDADDCYVKSSKEYDNQGCGITDDNAASFGAPFNAQSGGVVATVWDEEGIRAYSWPRGRVPADLAARKAPDEAGWGLPYARFEFGTECEGSHFHDHQIIFDLTLCGDWAGGTFAAQCPDKGGSCDDFIQHAANMQEAYWVVNYVDVYQDSAQPAIGRSQGFHGLRSRHRARRADPVRMVGGNSN